MEDVERLQDTLLSEMAARRTCRLSRSCGWRAGQEGPVTDLIKGVGA